MIAVPQSVGIRINSDDHYYDNYAQYSYKKKRSRLLKSQKMQAEHER